MSQDTTRLRVLDAAGEVFSELGFHAATIREICSKASVNIASVNYHFGDKKGLYVEVLKHAHCMRARQAPLPDWPPGTSAAVRLRDFIATIMRRLIGLEEMPWQWHLMMREMLQPSGACRELVEDYIRPHFDLLLSILDDLVPPETPLDKRQKIAFGIVGQCQFYRFNEVMIRMLLSEDELRERFDQQSLAEHVADMTLAALEGRPFIGRHEQQTTRITNAS